MVTIQLSNGTLDVGSSQAMELEVTAMRFSNGISDAYTNDLELPKTRNNIRLLECYNLLDSPNQLYGSQIKPAVLTVDGYMLDVHLQVVEVTDDAITVCLYGQTLPNDLRDREIRELIRDNENTIWAWWSGTDTYWPERFRRYDYGCAYMPGLAQLHPVMKANDVTAAISAVTGHSLPATDENMAVMAQNKYVCPQNRRQTLSVQVASEGGGLCIAAGQHVCNDAEGYTAGDYQASSARELNFTRDCTVTVSPYIAWGRKAMSGTHTMALQVLINGVADGGWSWTVNATGPRSGFLVPPSYTYTFQKGDRLSFALYSPTSDAEDKLDHFQMVWDMEYTGYAISDDDYGEELGYCGHLPILYGWAPNGGRDAYMFTGLQTERLRVYAWNGAYDPTSSLDVFLPLCTWSYFGYWCNITDITVGEYLWGLAWLGGHGVGRVQNGLEWNDSARTKEISGHITSVSPTTDRLGRRNYIRWASQDNPEPVSVIDSEFLEYDHDIAELPFALVTDGYGGLARVPQYSSKTNDDGTHEVGYSEIDGQVLVRFREDEDEYLYPALIPPPPIPDMGFSRMTSATEVVIETFDDQVGDCDYVYLDGRKFMVVSVSSELDTRLSRITALLVPTRNTPIQLWQFPEQ